MSVTRFFIAALLLPVVLGHGAVNLINIGGKPYTGPIPMQPGNPPSTAPSPIRQIDTGEPLMDSSDKSMSCGAKSQFASQVAPAMPGDEVQVNWAGTDGKSIWPHDVGPMFAYLASCGSQSCTKFDSSKAKWFKIAQAGQNADGTWGQAVLKAGKPYTYKLPSNIAPGEYLLRNEAVNMARETIGLVELYPSCTQIKIGGSGSGKPAAKDLVSFPGAYKKTDFLDFDPYTPSSKKFSMPGPALASLGSGNAPADPAPSSKSKSVASSATKSKMTKTKTSTAAKPTKTKTRKCNVKRSVRRSAAANESVPIQPVSYALRHKARFGHLHGRS